MVVDNTHMLTCLGLTNFTVFVQSLSIISANRS